MVHYTTINPCIDFRYNLCDNSFLWIRARRVSAWPVRWGRAQRKGWGCFHEKKTPTVPGPPTRKRNTKRNKTCIHTYSALAGEYASSMPFVHPPFTRVWDPTVMVQVTPSVSLIVAPLPRVLAATSVGVGPLMAGTDNASCGVSASLSRRGDW